MAYQSHFVVLSPNCLMDPIRKLVLEFGRLHLEPNGAQDINLRFDPEIDPANMMIPARLSPFYVVPTATELKALVDPERLVPFRSRQSKTMKIFKLRNAMVDDVCVWRIAHKGVLDARLLCVEGGAGLTDAPADIMLDVLDNIPRLQTWPFSPQMNPRAFRFVIAKAGLERIDAHRIPATWTTDGDDHIICERAI